MFSLLRNQTGIERDLGHAGEKRLPQMICKGLLLAGTRRESLALVPAPALPGHPCRTWFDAFGAALTDHRWFTVYDFISVVTPLVEILRECWSEHAFRHGVDVSAMEENARVVPSKLSALLSDPLFHSYDEMVRIVGRCLLRITKWLEECPCHSPNLSPVDFSGEPHHRRRQREHPSCPASGCRGPQLACGELNTAIQGLHRWSLAEVREHLRKEKFHDEAAFIAAETCLHDDLEHLRSYLEMGLNVKFDIWGKLPWRIMGLAHHVESERIGTAQTILAQFDAAAIPLEAHHLMTQRFLAPGHAAFILAHVLS